MSDIIEDDPMNQYSKPLKVVNTKFSKLFTMPVRANPEKPGRTLTVMWDERAPLIEGFVNRYSYIVRFTQPGGLAGNHYHKQKHELYQAIKGELKVILEDIETKEREEIILVGGDGTFLYVPPGLAHVVISGSEEDVLLVIAAQPEVLRDEFKYQVAEHQFAEIQKIVQEHASKDGLVSENIHAEYGKHRAKEIMEKFE